MSVRCMRIRLVAGGAERARQWAKEIMSRSGEAMGTLKQEGVTLESVFLDQLEGVDYLIYYMRSSDMARALAAGRTLADDLQQYHRQFQKEAWVSGQPLELLVDLQMAASEATSIP